MARYRHRIYGGRNIHAPHIGPPSDRRSRHEHDIGTVGELTDFDKRILAAIRASPVPVCKNDLQACLHEDISKGQIARTVLKLTYHALLFEYTNSHGTLFYGLTPQHDRTVPA